MRTRGKGLFGGEPQPLVLRLGHGSGGTEVMCLARGCRAGTYGNRNVTIMDNGVFGGEPGELGQVQMESAEHGEGEVIACLLT